jgi:transposase
MELDLAALPQDVDALHRLIRELAAKQASEHKALTEAQAEIERLQLIVKKLQRHQFGQRAERLEDGQLELGLEDLGADIARVEELLPVMPARRVAREPDRLSLPEQLEREELSLDLEVKACPCCGGALHPAGETVSEMLDWVPARLRVIRIRRPKYGCRSCGKIHQASAPERPIAKGLATPGLLAHVLVSKYCDHLPLYRQSQMFARQGVELDRSTLANWVGGAAWWLEPLRARMAEHVFGSQKLFADDTPMPVLDPGRGRTKTGRLWVYARDDRPWSGSDPPAAVYFYSPDRRAERSVAHLGRFKGTLQVDGYPGFEQLVPKGIVLAACWAHTRRKFYEVHQATGSPISAEALRRIAELYAVEDRIRGRSAELRRTVRQELVSPLLDSLKAWLEAELHRVAPRSPLSDAIRYALVRWEALCRFVKDGRVELDTNTVERAIRPIATRGSLCIPSSSVCKHWKRAGVCRATRATFSGHRRFDRRRREVVGTDLIRRTGNDLFSGKDARFNKATYRVVGNA